MLVGSFPRPYGGNSVHVQRLQFALAADYHVEVIDPYGSPQPDDDGSVLRCGSGSRGLLRTVVALWRSRAALVHFHVSGLNRFLVAAYPLLASVRPAIRKVVTIHSGSFERNFLTAPAWRRALLRDVLRRFDTVVVVNRSQGAFLESLGLPSERIAVVPAFLPPAAVETDRAREALAVLKGLRASSRYVGMWLSALRLSRNSRRARADAVGRASRSASVRVRYVR